MILFVYFLDHINDDKQRQSNVKIHICIIKEAKALTISKKKIQQWQKAQKNTNTLKFVLNIHQFMFYG